MISQSSCKKAYQIIHANHNDQSIKSTVAQTWNKFVYTAPNFVIDTAYKLDGQGRIVEFWTIPPDPSQPRYLAFTYNYDGNGNLMRNDPNIIYDDKVNPYRTNKVWQFLNRDYSLNNAIVADHAWPDTYNSFGLPTELESGGGSQFGVSNEDHTIVIEYACSMPKGPVNY